MKSRNAKTVVISLALMLVMCVATAVLSFSLAEETPTVGAGTSSTLPEGSLNATKTNIDYIIDNSNHGEVVDGRDLSRFYILEIGAAAESAVDSPLARMVLTDRVGSSGTEISTFVQQVINGWSTQNETMARKKIDYKYYQASALNTEAAIQEVITEIAQADLIYISNYPSDDKKFSKTNDIPEELKLLLAGAATSTYTPFIIDSPTKNAKGSGGSATAPKKISDFAKDVLATAGYNRNGKYYVDGTDIVGYLRRQKGVDSQWLPIQGNVVSGNWYVTQDRVYVYDYNEESDGSPVMVGGKVDYKKDSAGYPIIRKDEDHKKVVYEAKYEDVTDDDGNVTRKAVLDAWGHQVYVPVLDESGAYVYDETDTYQYQPLVLDSTPIYVQCVDASGNLLFETMKDEEGNDMIDADGKPVPDKTKPIYLVQLDAAGNQKITPSTTGGEDVKVYEPVYLTTARKTARILTVSSGTTTITDKLKETVGTMAYDKTEIQKIKGFRGGDAFVINPNYGNSTVFDTPVFYNYGYSKNYERPDNVIFETITPDKLETVATLDYANYDLIIFEDGIGGQTISTEKYNELTALVYGLKHIIYNKKLAAGTSNGEQHDDIVTSDAVNYMYLMEKVADANQTSRFDNVLVTGRKEMNIYASASVPSGVKPIVDIINNGSYRGIGGSDSSSNVYTVLEIQPCYPIDIELGKVFDTNEIYKGVKDEKRKGGITNVYDDNDLFYYYKLDAVLNDVTSDEISFDGGVTSLTDMESDDDPDTGISTRKNVALRNSSIINTTNAVDYYAWELSRAKIAHLTGLDYNQVKVVHMSTIELNTSRDSLLDNYDAIYIGGKNTAIKRINHIRDNLTDGRSGNAAIYNMYFHSGGTYSISGYGEPYSYTGNDLTYNRLRELENYANSAGMPVILSKDVTDAYYMARGGGRKNYTQTLLDPDSNMAKLLSSLLKDDGATVTGTGISAKITYPTDANGDVLYTSISKRSNILAAFDPDDQVKIPNSGGELGTTYGGYVTVFGGMDSDVMIYDETSGQTIPTTVKPSTTAVNGYEFAKVLRTGGQRPKFSLIQSPMLYVEGDDNTELTSNRVTFKYDVSSKNTYKVRVYIDDNTNSQFEETTEILFEKDGKNIKDGKFTVELPASFDGGMYWKFEIVSGKTRSSVTGLSKVHVREKNYVNVLQIMPQNAANAGKNKVSGPSLAFCTECQQARGILKGNRYTADGKYTASSAYSQSNYADVVNYSFHSITDADNVIPNPGLYDPAFAEEGSHINNLGLHRHNFGIVKYDSNYTIESVTGVDNWETNWAEDLYGDYDMDIEVVTTREFESMVREAMAAVDSDDDLTAYSELATIYKNYYMTMKEVVSGKVDVSEENTNYTYLLNKLTSSKDKFNETDDNETKGLFGESADTYKYESAQGGFSRGSSTSPSSVLNHNFAFSKNGWENHRFDGRDYTTTDFDVVVHYQGGNLSGEVSVTEKAGSGRVTFKWDNINIEYPAWNGWKYTEVPGPITNDNPFSVKVMIDDQVAMTLTPESGKSSDTKTYSFADIFAEMDAAAADKSMIKLDDYRVAQMNIDEYLKALDKALGTSHPGLATVAQVHQEIAYELKYHRYQDFFALPASGDWQNWRVYNVSYNKYYVDTDGSIKQSATATTANEFPIVEMEGLYIPWRNAKIFEEYFYKMYIKYLTFSTMKNVAKTGENAKYLPDLKKVYSCVVIGADEHFGNDDINDTDALATLVKFVEEDKEENLEGGHTFIFHQTIDAKASAGSDNYPKNLTENLKTLFGQDYSHSTDLAANKDVYFNTPFLSNGGTMSINPVHLAQTNQGTLTTDPNHVRLLYRASVLLYSDTQVPNRDSDFDINESTSFSTRATRTNKGIVTLYPFLISSELKIAGTHPNALSTDIEDSKMVVYYAFGGDSRGNQGSLAAADPQDGIDNYFLYSYGNVSYCGAGHTLVTGKHKDNNDERRLFINVILNSSRKSALNFGPTISVSDYELNPVTGEYDGHVKVKELDDGSYQMTVKDITEVPNFTYKVNTDAKDEVEEVRIYYDLSRDNTGTQDNFGFYTGDREIFTGKYPANSSLKGNTYKRIDNPTSDSRLTLYDDYFVPYGQKYTYIVIAVKTKNEKAPVYQRIKILLAPKLWDLT